MRRSNFLVGALVALVTFVSLSAFVGRRPWGWRHHHCYYNDRDRYDDRNINRTSTDREPLRDSIPIQ